MLWSAGGRLGRHPCSICRSASRYTIKSTSDNESLVECRLPADMASSILTVIFVSDSRSRMIRTLSVSMNECKTSRIFFRRIVSNGRDKSIYCILVTYSYRWHLAASHRCPDASCSFKRQHGTFPYGISILCLNNIHVTSIFIVSR